MIDTDVTDYEDLANGIILRASKDYKKALRTLKDKPNDMEAYNIKVSIESFFCSEWFCVLTNTCGKTIMTRIQRGVENENRNYKRITKIA